VIKIPSTVDSFLHKVHTATDDNPFRLVNESIPFYEGNFYCISNNAYHGDGVSQQAPFFVGDVVYFPKGNLKDIWFKNYTAGSNTKIVFVGTVPTAEVKSILGI